MKRILTAISIALGITLCTWIGSAIGIARASRNSSGTYSLPNSPFVSGTVISSSVMNGNFSDVSSELTDSLSRSGKGGMLAPVRVPDGSQSSPTMSFTNETGTGFYRIGSIDLGLSMNGTKRQEWTSTGASVVGTLAATGALSAASVTASTVRPATSASLDVRALGDVSPAMILGTSGTLAAGNVLSIQNNASVLATLAYTGDWDMGGHLIKNASSSPSASTDVATKGYVDGRFPIDNSKQNFGSPSASTDVAIKSYVDGKVGTVTPSQVTISGASTSGTIGGLAILNNDANYKIIASPSAFTGTPPTNASIISSITKNVASFTLTVLTAPGVGNSITYDVVIVR